MCLLDKDQPENKNKIILNNYYYFVLIIYFQNSLVIFNFSVTVNLSIKFMFSTNKSESSFS